MSKKPDLDVLGLAAAVGGVMNEIDASSVNKGSVAVGHARKIHPRDFIPGAKPTANGQNATSSIAREAMIQAPKSTPAGRDVVGTVPIEGIEGLQIEAPPDIADMVAKLEGEIPPPVRENAVPIPGNQMVPGNIQPVVIPPPAPKPQMELDFNPGVLARLDRIENILKSINDRLSKISKL